MESYLEVSFFHNVCTIALSFLLGEYASMQPVSIWRVLLYAFMVSAFGCFLWFPYAIWIILLIEAFFFFLCFRRVFKAYFSALTIRILCYLSAFLFFGGGFHNGLWFVPMDGKGVVALWIVYGCAVLLLMAKWKHAFALTSYVYDAMLFLQETKLHLKGYLDSGNLLTYEQIPIVFIDKKYQTYFKNQNIELIVMNSVTSSEVIRCYACRLQLAGCRIQQVYVNCDRHLQLPLQCDVLLNVNVMTTG